MSMHENQVQLCFAVSPVTLYRNFAHARFRLSGDRVISSIWNPVMSVDLIQTGEPVSLSFILSPEVLIANPEGPRLSAEPSLGTSEYWEREAQRVNLHILDWQEQYRIWSNGKSPTQALACYASKQQDIACIEVQHAQKNASHRPNGRREDFSGKMADKSENCIQRLSQAEQLRQAVQLTTRLPLAPDQ